MARKIEIEIVGDANNFQKSLGKAAGSTDSFGKSLLKMGGYAAAAIGAAGIGGLALTLKAGIAEFSEAAKVGAQTNAVLKSTGAVANVTSKQVSNLAESLMRKSGVDDEAIQSGENMLLTFTRVRNEAGKGNDIFNQATKATLNLSVALGKDMPSAALLVGKALNDPVKGMNAMTRAGIQFTDAQKAMIKGMIESGNVMGAQKIILGELETQFGGSAEALGKTLPGQINILKESFSNMAGTMVSHLVPAFTSVMNGATDFVDRLSNAQGASAKFGVVIDEVKSLAGKAWAGLKAAFNAINWGQVWDTVRDAFSRAVSFLTGLPWGQWLGAVASTAWNALKSAFNAINWGEVGDTIGDLLVTALNRLSSFISKVNWNNVGQQIIHGIGVALKALGSFLAGVDWVAVLSALTKGIVAVLKALGGVLLGIASSLGKAILSGLQAGLANLGGWFSEKLQALPNAITGMIGTVSSLAVTLGRAIVQGAISGIQSLVGSLVDTARNMALAPINAAKGLLGIGSPSKVFAGIGEDTVRGFILGITTQMPALEAKTRDAVTKALDAAKATVEKYQGILGDAFGKLGDFVKRAFDAKTQNLLDNVTKKFDKQIAKWQGFADALTPAEQELAAIDAAEAQRSRDAATRAAADALVAAQAMEAGIERERAIAAAEEQIRQASLAVRRAQLEETAAVERAAREKTAAEHIAKLEETKARELRNLEERRNQLAASLDDQLSVLTARLSKHPEEYDKIQKKIQALLKSYGIPMQKSGELLGKAFAKGLDDAADDVTKSAKKLAEIVAKYLKLKSPAERGPLSTLDHWFDPMGPMLAKSMRRGAGVVGAAAAGLAARPAMAAGGGYAMAGAGGGGGWPERIVLQVDGRTLAEVNRRQYQRHVARNA